MVYLDTSVLVAYYIPETLSQVIQERLRTATTVAVSEWAQTEFVAALSLRQRIGDLSLADVKQVTTLFVKHLDDNLYHSLHLNRDVYRQARDYITRFDLPLKAPDALHLAAAALEAYPLITADRQLAHNAETLGIAVELLTVT